MSQAESNGGWGGARVDVGIVVAAVDSECNLNMGRKTPTPLQAPKTLVSALASGSCVPETPLTGPDERAQAPVVDLVHTRGVYVLSHANASGA